MRVRFWATRGSIPVCAWARPASGSRKTLSTSPVAAVETPTDQSLKSTAFDRNSSFSTEIHAFSR
jgi:hypothetical protein